MIQRIDCEAFECPVDVQSPRVAACTPTEAQLLAQCKCEPIFVPISVCADDRGWSIMNQLQGVLLPNGRINFSMQYPGVTKAWHRHNLQTNYWICLTGNLKVGVSEKRTIRRANSLWRKASRNFDHSFNAMAWRYRSWTDSAGLLYYVTQSYDPVSPDEERRAASSVPGFRWENQHH